MNKEERLREKKVKELAQLNSDFDYVWNWWVENLKSFVFYKVGSEWNSHNFQNQDKCSYLLLCNRANIPNNNHSWCFMSKEGTSKNYGLTLDVDKETGLINLRLEDKSIESWKERKNHPVRQQSMRY